MRFFIALFSPRRTLSVSRWLLLIYWMIAWSIFSPYVASAEDSTGLPPRLRKQEVLVGTGRRPGAIRLKGTLTCTPSSQSVCAGPGTVNEPCKAQEARGRFILKLDSSKYYRCTSSESEAQCLRQPGIAVELDQDTLEARMLNQIDVSMKTIKVSGPQMLATIEASGGMYSEAAGSGFLFVVSIGSCTLKK